MFSAQGPSFSPGSCFHCHPFSKPGPSSQAQVVLQHLVLIPVQGLALSLSPETRALLLAFLLDPGLPHRPGPFFLPGVLLAAPVSAPSTGPSLSPGLSFHGDLGRGDAAPLTRSRPDCLPLGMGPRGSGGREKPRHSATQPKARTLRHSGGSVKAIPSVLSTAGVYTGKQMKNLAQVAKRVKRGNSIKG